VTDVAVIGTRSHDARGSRPIPMTEQCTFCGHDAGQSKLYVSLGPDLDPRFHICSACYLVAVRHGYQVVYRTAA
jgi:hypothetical protein